MNMWLSKKPPIEKEELQTKKELVALYNAEEQIRIVLGLLDTQIEKEVSSHISAVDGSYWKEIIPHLKNAKSYIIKSKKENIRTIKLTHKFNLPTNANSEKKIDHTLKSIVLINDEIVNELESIINRAEKNKDLCRQFINFSGHKHADIFNRDAPDLVRKFNSKIFAEDSQEIWKMITSLIKQIRTILNKEKSLEPDKKLS